MRNILYLLFLICISFTLRAQNLQSAFYEVQKSLIDTCKHPVNLVVNARFNAGNSGFNSTLPYGVNCWPGYYYVGPNMQSKCGSWPVSFVDHSTGTGNFLIVDGDPTNAPQDVWMETVSVMSGVDYTFSFWAKNLYSQYPFPLGFVINGLQIATTSTITPVIWSQYTTTWTATVSGTVTIAIRQITAGHYRDFGIDDIYFGFCDDQAISIGSLQTLQNEVTVFPNPSTGIFAFNLENRTSSTGIDIYDLVGNRILSKDVQGSSNARVDLSGYSKGIYFAEILSNGRKTVAKLILE